MAPGRLVALLVVAGVLAGCGSTSERSNGEALKSADQVLVDVAAAVRKAGSVHLVAVGTAGYDATPLSHDLRLSAEGTVGRVSFHDHAVDVVRVGGTVYLEAPPAFYTQGSKDPAHDAIAADVLGDRWIAAPREAAEYALLFVPQWRALVDGIFSSRNPGFSNTGEVSIDGRSAVALTHARSGTTLYVSATGEPLPLELTDREGTSGYTFDDWGDPVELEAPAGVVELSGAQADVLAQAVSAWVPADE